MVREKMGGQSFVPMVVKIGGSLSTHLEGLVPVLLDAGRPLLIIPGGGTYADSVRKSGVDNDTAHWMAIAAMDRYGKDIISHGIKATVFLQVPNMPVVLLPSCSMRQYDPLPHSWDITSDSIAAWVADFLELPLLLLKSVDGIEENGCLVKQVNIPLTTDVVDPFFIPFVLERKIPATIINGCRLDRVSKFLEGGIVFGTVIGTTF